MDVQTREALAQVNEILKHTEDSILELIPQKIKNYIKTHMSTDITFKVDETLELFEQPITQEAKRILATLYRDYICNDDEKKEIAKLDMLQLEKEEEIKRQKYAVDVFAKKIKTSAKFDSKKKH